jgi:lipoic acid synthetase
MPRAVIEILTPDFQGREESVAAVLDARPDIFNHNIETVPRLYPTVRPEADYRRSLAVLAYAKRQAGAGTAAIFTKSGLMVGLGETDEEVRSAMRNLREVGCDILTIGQYLAPSPQHAPVARFVEPAEFAAWESQARALGFAAVAAGPFVRSSYQAEDVFRSV